jgi:hypothetical protein
VTLTKAQKKALDWLRERGGGGAFDRHGVVLAAGETAPFMRSTWHALRNAGVVEFYRPSPRGAGRVRLVSEVA